MPNDKYLIYFLLSECLMISSLITLPFFGNWNLLFFILLISGNIIGLLNIVYDRKRVIKKK